MSIVADIVRRLANPFTGLDLVPGIVRCALDATAQRISGAWVERLFETSSPVRRLTRAFQVFLDDPEAVLALKKAFHLALEERMRIVALHADPTDRHGYEAIPLPALNHPLDPVALRAFEGHDPRPRKIPASATLRGRLAFLLVVLLNATTLVGMVIAIGLGRGRHPTTPRRHVTVGSPVIASAEYWHMFRLGLVDAGVWHDDAIGIFGLVRGTLDGYDGDGLLVDDPWRLPIDKRRWWRHVVLPVFRLVAATVGRAVVHVRDAQVAQVARDALVLARQTMPLRRLLDNYRLDFLLDLDEYTASHIVHGILMRGSGGRIVRWPHSQMDSPGATLSYLGYDLFLGGGPYMADTYGDTWRQDCRRESVGLIKNDRHFLGAQWVAPRYAAAVDGARKEGRKIAVLFGAGTQQGNGPMIRANMRASLEAFAGEDNWLLIVKAKGHKGYRHLMDLVEMDDELRHRIAAANVVVVRYDASEQEVCSTGWLIGVMDCAVGTGSVQIEAVTQRKRCLWYMPVFHDTPYNRALERAGMLFRDAAELTRVLQDHAEALSVPAIADDWFRRALDPFGDDQAIARLANLLWRESAKVPHSERSLARNVA